MMFRTCIDCGAPTQRRRCPKHTAIYQARHKANYGAEHQAIRAVLASSLPAPCGYHCGKVLRVSDDWVAAHLRDGDPLSPRIVACRSCNERAKRSESRVL